MSLVNWDVIIAKYNLNKFDKDNLDVAFLLTLSDKALPLMLEHQEKFDKEGYLKNPGKRGTVNYKEYLLERKEQFLEKYPKYSWCSWNLADDKAYHLLHLYSSAD